MQALRLLLLISCCFCLSQALICDRCEGTPESCASGSRQENCAQFGSDQVCANFFYFSQGRPQVQKGCYQRSACRTQESRADNFCGEFDGKDKPCRCCCTTNECNRPTKGCIVPSKCGFPKKKKIGKYHCPKTTTEGSVCNFTCPKTYDQFGSPTTKCIQGEITRNLVWYPTNQRCSRIRCKALKAPENGKISCVNVGRYKHLPDFIYAQTMCRISCNKGYRLRGPAKTVCKKNSRWSTKGQACIPDPCLPFKTDKNRIDSCTKGNLVGSVCTFKCKKGYKLVGERENECVDFNTSKQWDKKPPKCVKVRCFPVQTAPTHGTVSCTNSNFENSVCTFRCNKGYDMEGTTKQTTTAVCEDDGDGDDIGKWNGKAKKCVRIECTPRITAPDDGSIDCTNTNLLGSVCTFRCNKGYDLDGTASVTLKSECLDDGNGDNRGIWSRRAPTCTIIKCMPPHTDPENGKVKCSDANNLKSSCKFTCNDGYDLAETKADVYTSDCEDDGDGDALGVWSKPPATCVIKKCKPVIKPDHAIYSCTNDNVIGSTCTFECEFGWMRIGERRITCSDKKRDGDARAEWSAKEPSCEQIFCPPQEHDTTVVSVCDQDGYNSFAVDTVCTYRCAREGYYLVSKNAPTVAIKSGTYDVKCLPTSKWNNPAPRCIKVKCRPVIAPENGFRPSCTDANWLGSTCTFRCLPTYALTHAEELKCVSDGTDADKIGEWDRSVPQCKKNECDDYGQINNGKISYSNKLNIGSIMTLVCNTQFTFKQYETAECLPADESNGQEVPYWSRRRNVCCVPCIFNNRLRVVALIDKTAAKSFEEWNDIATWQYYITEYLFTKKFDIKYSVVLYDGSVDEVNSMSEKLLRNSEEVEDIMVDLQENSQFGGDSSDTANALKYVEENIFKRYTDTTSSRRPSDEPFIFLVKRKGVPERTVIEAAKSILNRRVHILSLGFRKDDWEKEERELIKITADPDRVLMMGGLQDIQAPGILVTQISKDQGCSPTSKTRPCT